MKILIPETISQKGITLLKSYSHFDVHFDSSLSYKDVLKIIGEYEGIITRSGTPITKELLDVAKKLKLIGRAGVGVDNIDMKTASERGILVVNVPAGNILAATEHTIALLLSATRQIPLADSSIRKGKWERKNFMGTELSKKTLGIIGFGKIGSRVAKRLKSFDMSIVAYDPYVKKERIESFGVTPVSLDELLQMSDFITVHTPLTEETKGMISKREIQKMKKNVRIINCARGGIYDEQALYEALKEKRIIAAAVDVFEKEPIDESPLQTLENIVLTPHLGANTSEAQENVSVEISKKFIEFYETGFLADAINAPFADIEMTKLLKSYMGLVEKMSKILDVQVQSAIKKIKVVADGFETDELVKPLLISAIKGILESVLGEGINYVNALFEAEERDINVAWEYNKKSHDFNQKVIVYVHTENEKYSIGGTCFGFEQERIISIDEYNIELKPEGILLFIRNADIPGVIGRVGMLFLKYKINIAEYRLGRSEISQNAFAAVVLDEKPKKKILEQISQIEGIRSVQLIDI